MSLKIEDIVEVLKELKIAGSTIAQIENKLEKVEEEKKEERAEGKAPKSRTQFVTILFDADNKLANLGDFTSIVVQIPAEDDAGTVLERIYRATYEFNTTRKGRKNPVKTVGDAIAHVKRAQFKAQNIHVKVKEPIRVVVSDNQIPMVKSGE